MTDPTPVAARPTCFKPDETVTGDNPASTFPFLIVEVSDRLDVAPLTVNMSFQASKEVPEEFISTVWMNLDPSINPDALVFAFNSSTPGAPSTEAPGSIGLKGAKACGGKACDIEVLIDENNVSPSPGETGQFDIQFEFPTSGGPGGIRLDSFDLVQIFISCSLAVDADCASFNEESFNFFSASHQGSDTFRICEQEQGIPGTGEGSGKICGRRVPVTEVPSPAALMLVGLGLAAVGYVGRRTWRR